MIKQEKRLHDPRTPKDRGTDQPVFRIDEQKLAVIQSLQVEDIIFHKDIYAQFNDDEYARSFSVILKKLTAEIEHLKAAWASDDIEKKGSSR